MTTEAFVVHHIPGRCRLRLPGMRGDGVFFEQLAQDLEATFDGCKVAANAVTGSLLLQGDVPAIDVLRDTGRQAQWFELQEGQHLGWKRALESAELFEGDDLRDYLAAAFLALAAVQVLRGQIMVPATSFLMYALAASAISSRSS